MYFRLIITLLVLCSTLLISQDKRPMTAEDIWKIKRVSGLQISPDKSTAVVTVAEFDIKENKGNTDIHLIDLATKQSKKLTTSRANDVAPIWSPDGKQIAFISRRDGDDVSQIYLIPVDGGEAERLTELPTSPTSLKWSEDGEKIYFAANVFLGFENDFAELKKEIKKRKENKVTAKVTENRFYRHWDIWLTDGYVTHIFQFDLKTKTAKNLTPGLDKILSTSGSGAEFDVSPDGKKIALIANSTLPPFKEELNFDLYLFDTDNFKSLVNLTADNLADDSSPEFSSDSKFLFYTKRLHPDKQAENGKLARFNLETKEAKLLSADIDLSVMEKILSDDLKSIYFTAEDSGRVSIYNLDVNGNNLSKVFAKGTNGAIELGKNKIYFLHQSLSYPTELFSHDLVSKKTEQVSFFNKNLMDSLVLGKVEDLYFPGANDAQVQMYLLYPPNFDPKKKYGLVHLIHGGPHQSFNDDFHPRWNAQVFAAMGYFVATVNFHGSTGWGEAFAESIVGKHAPKPFTDVMRATDFLIKNYKNIDSLRLGAAGGSYGGYLVNWIAGHTNRFSALVSHAGVYNFMGQFASDITHFREIAYGGSPWENKENLMRYNPSEFAANFNTPMLVIHGEKDYRVVVTQGLELYGVLQGKGVPSRLIYYPDENHWILQPQNSIFWYNEIESWFKRFLK